MKSDSKHILVLLKFHPERELRLIEEFYKDGYTYDVIAPSFRVKADWDYLVSAGDIQPAVRTFVLPGFVKELTKTRKSFKQKPAVPRELYERAIIADKTLSKLGEHPRSNFFLSAYLELIDNHIPLDNYKAIIGEISSAFEVLLFYKAKQKALPYAYFIASPITKDTFFFIDDRYQIRHLEEIYTKLLFREHPKDTSVRKENESKTPGYMQFNNQTKIDNLLRQNKLSQGRLKRLENLVKTYHNDKRLATDFVPGPMFYLGRLMRWYRFFILKGLGRFLWNKGIEKGNYVLFLQYEPEITTSLYAYPFKTQKQWIQTVLTHVEKESILYIKEHPAMFSKRSLSFYLSLKKHRRVVLVDPSVPSKELMNGAKAVLTLNSTVGIESLKLGTPVISFGNAYFNIVPEILKWSQIAQGKGLKYLQDLKFPSKELLQRASFTLEAAIKQIEYTGCQNDHRLDSYVLSSENMHNIKCAIEAYVGQD